MALSNTDTSNSFASPQFPGNIGLVPHDDSLNGTKRLASCREELELSWRSGAALPHAVSPSNSYSSDNRSDVNHKRQKTIDSVGDAMDSETPSGCYPSGDGRHNKSNSYARGMRITSSNRPNTSAQQPNSTSGTSVKSGWYEGEIDALGNRHGKGVTKHDDGTEHEGNYVMDVMDGPGCFKFVTSRQIVPFRTGHLLRQTERFFQGTFRNGRPNGYGSIVARTFDVNPQAPGQFSAPSSSDVRFMQITHDLASYSESGTPVGEGVRFIFTKSETDSSWDEYCLRMYNGNCTNVRVATDYAEWVCSCMGIDHPVPPT